jgi:hypothetical protein
MITFATIMMGVLSMHGVQNAAMRREYKVHSRYVLQVKWNHWQAYPV